MQYYSQYGLNIMSDISLEPLFEPLNSVPVENNVSVLEMTMEIAETIEDKHWQCQKEIIEPTNGKVVSLIRFNEDEVRYDYIEADVTFYLRVRELIVYYRAPCAEIIPIYLSYKIIPFFANCQGLFLLHASCIGIGEYAYAFCAPHGGGKSTVATSIIQARPDISIISDDILPIKIDDGIVTVSLSSHFTRIWNPVGQDKNFDLYPCINANTTKKVVFMSKPETTKWILSKIYFIKRWNTRVPFLFYPISSTQIEKLLLHQYYETGYSYFSEQKIEDSLFIKFLSRNVAGCLTIVDEPLSNMDKWAKKFLDNYMNTNMSQT